MTPIHGRMGKKDPNISHLLPFSLWQCFPLKGPAGNPRTTGSEDAAIGVRPLWHRADRGGGEGIGVEGVRYEGDWWWGVGRTVGILEKGPGCADVETYLFWGIKRNWLETRWDRIGGRFCFQLPPSDLHIILLNFTNTHYTHIQHPKGTKEHRMKSVSFFFSAPYIPSISASERQPKTHISC